MDHRDWRIWIRAAEVEKARRQKAACEAASFPYYKEETQQDYMDRLIEKITGDRPGGSPDAPARPSAEQEAEWAKNRAELAAMFGRKS